MFCPSCGNANDDSSRFCRSCGNALASSVPAVQQAPPPPPTPYAPQQPQYYAQQPDPRMRGGIPAQRQYAIGKSPGLALVLSLLIVGIGQFYNGDVKKGVIMLIAAFVTGIFTFGFGWFAIAIWSAVDAFQVASGKSPLWT